MVPTTSPGRAQRSTRRPLMLATALAVTGIAAAACGAGGYTYGASANQASTATATKSAVVSTHSTSLGNVLASSSGRTLYVFEKDTGTSSSCAGGCASVWPPVTTSGSPTALGMANQSLLGTTHRSDGLTQVTYDGHPLYYYVGDTAAGDVSGQGLDDFGAEWAAVSANGHEIDAN